MLRAEGSTRRITAKGGRKRDRGKSRQQVWAQKYPAQVKSVSNSISTEAKQTLLLSIFHSVYRVCERGREGEKRIKKLTNAARCHFAFKVSFVDFYAFYYHADTHTHTQIRRQAGHASSVAGCDYGGCCCGFACFGNGKSGKQPAREGGKAWGGREIPK